jgi:signal transduction histidine kinase
MKSLFVKYITAVAVIMLVSFLMLSSIISVSIDDFATEARRDDVTLISTIAAAVIQEEYKAGGDIPFTDFATSNQDELEHILHTIARDDKEISFLVVDAGGTVLASCIRTNGVGSITSLPAELMADILDEDGYQAYGKLNGLLTKSHLICARPLRVGENTVGAMVACSTDTSADALVNVMNKSVFLANLWVMLAIMIAVYFITERLLAPLREMRQAAKDFSHGKFDTRIQVVGSDEIAEFATTFNSMAESLAQSENLRSTFLANVSHDLRTPMTTIAGYVDGILSGAIPPEKQEHYLQIVSSETHRLSRLVSQLLDISRLEAGMRQFNPSEFDVCELARIILISFESKIDEKRLEVEFETDDDRMPVLADKDAIHQILYNICENAIKFSREGGLLKISITQGERGKYNVCVYNEGKGISKEDLPYVFDRFYKSDKSRGLDKVGVGLGLFIVKTMLNACGESIHAESEEGKYCSFTFTIKRAS